MEKVKAYTDIVQSKKLAEILPIESADMEYLRLKETNATIGSVPFVKDESEVENSAYDAVYDRIPCWSLAALLDLLPNNEHIETNVSRGSWKIDTVEYVPNTWWCEYEDNKNQTEFNISADNSIDACYEMIIKLHEQNIL